MRIRTLLIGAVISLVGGLLSSCATPTQSPTAPTAVLEVPRAEYAATIQPHRVKTVDIRVSDLAFSGGDRVKKGESLRKLNSRQHKRLSRLKRRISTIDDRNVTVRNSVQGLNLGRNPSYFTYASDLASTLASQEASINSAISEIQQAGLEHRRELSEVGTADASASKSATTSVRAQKRYLRRSYALSQKAAREALRSQYLEYAQALREQRKQMVAERDALTLEAPWEGLIDISGTNVRLLSERNDVHFNATEAQARRLSSVAEFDVIANGTSIATATFSSMSYSQESSTAEAPSYQVVFAATMTVEDYLPLENAAVKLAFESDGLTVGSDYLGQDGDQYYVIQHGERVMVSASRDEDGDWIIVSDQLHAGDSVELIAGAS